jgi:poly(A) polymerase Pap1
MCWSKACDSKRKSAQLYKSKAIAWQLSKEPFILSQEYFFRSLHDMLAEMPEVSELHPVPDAHVPVLGFKLNGISIDLLYANLAHVVIPEVNCFCTLSEFQYYMSSLCTN